MTYCSSTDWKSICEWMNPMSVGWQFDRLNEHLWMNEPNECWMTVRQIDWASVNEWTQWVLNDSLTDWLNIYGWMNPMSVGWMTAAATTTLGYEWWSGRRGLKLRLIRTTRKNSPVNDLRWKNSPQAFPSQDLQYIPHSSPPPPPLSLRSTLSTMLSTFLGVDTPFHPK